MCSPLSQASKTFYNTFFADFRGKVQIFWSPMTKERGIRNIWNFGIGVQQQFGIKYCRMCNIFFQNQSTLLNVFMSNSWRCILQRAFHGVSIWFIFKCLLYSARTCQWTPYPLTLKIYLFLHNLTKFFFYDTLWRRGLFYLVTPKRVPSLLQSGKPVTHKGPPLSPLHNCVYLLLTYIYYRRHILMNRR